MRLRAFHVGLVFVVLAVNTSCAQPSFSPTNPLQGAWLITAIEPGDGSGVIDPAQPGLYIFAREHYSVVYAPGAEPRASSAAAFAPTQEEMLAQYGSFIVNTGTYEISGSTVTFRPMIARSPEFVGGQSAGSFDVEGDVLTLRLMNVTAANGMDAPNVGGSMMLRRLE